jgi:hypothetical protein
MSAAEIVGIVAAIVTALAAIFGMLVVFFKIAKSINSTQVSVANIEIDITKINTNLGNYETRLQVVETRSILSEDKVKSAFLRLDEDRKDAKELIGDVKDTLQKGIDEIKDNCKEIQAEKRKKVMG